MVDFGAPPEMISDDTTINALDIDSFSIVELTSSTQRNHSVETPRKEISRETTVVGPVAVICTRTGAATAESDGRSEPAVLKITQAPRLGPHTARAPACRGDRVVARRWPRLLPGAGDSRRAVRSGG
ncbi:acyl carrier protein [Streptomyces sp. 900105755]